MKKLLKTIALSLALTLIFPLLVSCSEKDKNGIADSESILSCGSREISYGLYKYFFLNYKDNYKKEQLEENAEKIYAEITEDCLESLSGVYGVVTLCEQYGIYTTDADIKEKVNATIDSICEQNINEENDKTGIKGYSEWANKGTDDRTLALAQLVQACVDLYENNFVIPDFSGIETPGEAGEIIF